ncbi:MAG TPA: TIGR04563 family protein [Myxococcales bacterium]|nr:TIGR04563 family protein [Myxococcales bacterium]
MSANDARKQSLYFPEDMLNEIQQQAQRLDRSLSWVVQQAWKISKSELRKIPSPNDMLDDDPASPRG